MKAVPIQNPALFEPKATSRLSWSASRQLSALYRGQFAHVNTQCRDVGPHNLNELERVGGEGAGG